MNAPAPVKKPRSDWTGTYAVLRDGRPFATLTVTRQWTAGGPRHTARLSDGRSVSHSDAGYAVHEALKLLAPGEQVWPWYTGCSERGLRLRAENKAPWESSEEVAP